MHVIRKNAREAIRLQMSDFHGKTFLDVRIWADGEGGEPRPTPKGVTVPLAALPAFVEAVALIGKEERPEAL